MKPSILNSAILDINGTDGNLLKILNVETKKITDSTIDSEQIQIAIENSEEYGVHIVDSSIHVLQTQKDEWSESATFIKEHVENTDIHVSEQEKIKWDASETEEGAQNKANVVQTNLTAHIENITEHVTQQEKNKWTDKYTIAEVDNMISGILSESYYKPAVDTFDDLLIEYPDAIAGWLAVVETDNITYRYDGLTWRAFTNDTVPMATSTLDGKMSKEDKIKMDTVSPYANYYQHPTGSQYNHVTDNEKEYWSDKASSDLVTTKVDGLMDHLQFIKLESIASGANNYIHPELHDASIIKESTTKQFVTAAEKESWSNKASTAPASSSANGIMTKELFIKLYNIEEESNKYIHPSNHSLDMITETDVYKLVTAAEKEAWNLKETPTSAQSKVDVALMSAKAYIDSEIAKITGGGTNSPAYSYANLAYSKWITYPDSFAYIITLLSPVDCSNIKIGIDLSATAEQMDFLKNCNLQISNTENNTVITISSDLLPTINLPILLIFGTPMGQL